MILVVDDHPDSGEALRQLLIRVGHKAYSVNSGEEALGFIRAVRPALVVLDVRMPGMSGLDLLRIMRSEEELKDTAVMMYSADPGIDVSREALNLGARDFVAKGQADWMDLLGRIDQLYRDPVETESAIAAPVLDRPPTTASRRTATRSHDIQEMLKRARERIHRSRDLIHRHGFTH